MSKEKQINADNIKSWIEQYYLQVEKQTIKVTSVFLTDLKIKYREDRIKVNFDYTIFVDDKYKYKKDYLLMTVKNYKLTEMGVH